MLRENLHDALQRLSKSSSRKLVPVVFADNLVATRPEAMIPFFNVDG